LFRDAYERVIVDPAPTGHLLRLLEMPQLALSWSHQLMRLLLKYKDVTGLGDTARDLLELSRDLRALDTLLRDPERCGLVIVTLDEPVVRRESERLAAEVRRLGVRITGVVLNHADTSASALPVVDAEVQFEAPAADSPPVGVDALRRWCSAWVAR
jgi:arsenite-transporting ATPase